MTVRRVALVHGWGGSGEATWLRAGWADALAEAGFEPVAIDLPGHGPGGGSHDPVDYADMATDLAAMLPAGLWGAIGFSLGTKLLLELELRSPGANGRLVLGGIGDNVFAPERAGPAIVAALTGATPPDDQAPAVRALVDYSRLGGSDPLCLAAVLQRPANPVITAARLAGSGAPILLVNSRDDQIAMPDTALRAALPAADYLELAGTGHIGLTAASDFRRAAVGFLTRA